MTTTHPIHDDPSVRTAAQTAASAQARFQEASALARRYERLIAPDTDEQIDELLRLDAMANYANARIEVLKAEAAFITAQRAETDAREAARRRAVDSVRSEERQAIEALRIKLREVCKANVVLRDIQHRKHEITGQPFEALSWFELNDHPDGRLAQWEARVKEYGF